jgi:hypothetical protein
MIGKEVYVYRNGELIYKKWINQKHGVVFQNYKIWHT